MSLLLCLFALSTVVVICTPYVGIAYAEVILTIDAQPIAPSGTYVVPERGNVTFTCNSTSGTDLLWSLNVTVAMKYYRILSNTAGLNGRTGFSVSNESTVNPASFTLHHISLANNPSSVECRDLSIQDGSKNRAVVMILVEVTHSGTVDSCAIPVSGQIQINGSPNCPTIYTAINTTTFAVLIQKLQMTWLPEKYSVQVISSKQSIASIVHSSTLKGTTSFEVTPIQPDTVYNITVIPCNMAGCNESCDVHTVQTDSEMNMEVPTGSDRTPRVVTVQPHIIFIGVAILVTMVLLLLIASLAVGCIIRRKRGKQTIPQTSNVDAVHVHHASLQLQDHDVTSATAAQYMDVGVTSSDITMEANPAYQSIVMQSAGSNYI